MKTFVKPFLIVLISVSLIMGLNSCVKKDKDIYELRLAHFFPASHPAEEVFIKGWIEKIESATQHRVKITSYPGGTLLGANDVYNGVVSGITDIGMSCFSYTRGLFPVLEAFELPGVIYKNSKVASKVAWEGIKQLDLEEVKGTKLLTVIASGPGDLFSKYPIKNPDDIIGVEIRATGLSAGTISILGGIPVDMPQSNAYEALSRGVVKGNLSPVEVLKGWKHAEVTDYITRTPFLYNTLFFLNINLDAWNNLPEDIQNIFIDVTEEFHEQTGIGLWDMQNELAMDYAVNEQGMEVIVLSEQETQNWIELVTPIQDKYNDDIKKIGIEQDVLGIIKGLAEQYNKIY